MLCRHLGGLAIEQVHPVAEQFDRLLELFDRGGKGLIHGAIPVQDVRDDGVTPAAASSGVGSALVNCGWMIRPSRVSAVPATIWSAQSIFSPPPSPLAPIGATSGVRKASRL